MVNQELTVKVNADAEEAIEEIERVTEAVNELNEALGELGSSGMELDFTMNKRALDDLYRSTSNSNIEIDYV